MTTKTQTTKSRVVKPLPLKLKRRGFRRLSEIQEKLTDWVYYPYLARKQLTIMEGDPEAGKSFLTQAIIKGLVDDDDLPSSRRSLQAEPGNVVMFDCENEGETVLRKRFRLLGLNNADRVAILEDPFNITSDNVPELIEELKELEPLLIVFDTINDYLDHKADTHRSKDTVQALQPFVQMARELNCSVLLLRHLTKDSGKRALHRGQGSVSFTGKSRLQVLVVQDPDDEDRRVFVASKASNVKRPPAREFFVEDISKEVKEVDAFRFTWGNKTEDTPDGLLEAQREVGRPPEKLGEAIEFLRAQLGNGSVPHETLLARAEARSFSAKTLDRASRKLGVKKSGGNNSVWKL